MLVRILSLILLATLSFSIWQPTAEETEPDTLTGHFLVSTNQLRDPGFAKTVVYIIKHSADGAMGIIVNRPRGKVSLAEISEMMGLELSEDQTELVVFYGGPVELDRGLLLHSSDVLLETSHLVTQGVAVTSDPALLESIAQGAGPENYIFALGYAGWAPNQLEREIAAGSWLTQEADLPSLFAEEPEKTWELLIGKRVFRL